MTEQNNPALPTPGEGMRFRIHATNAVTAERMSFVVQAANPAEAHLLAKATGYYVSSISPEPGTSATGATRIPRKRRRLKVAIAALLVGISVVAFVRNQSSRDEPLTTLNRDQLALASPTIELNWTTWRAGKPIGLGGWQNVPDATEGGQGSAVVTQAKGGKIYLATNLHCLDLQDIIATKTTDIRVQKYAVTVSFPNGQKRNALRIAHPKTGIDLAMLEVDGSGLEAGKDYIALSPYTDDIQAGDEVAAVGSPLGLTGTQTFGHVSARRDENTNGVTCRWIQIDAAVNQGNSGGPLLVKQGNSYHWVGINSEMATLSDSSAGLNFAIDARQVSETEFQWYDASAWGVANCLYDFYQVNAGTH